MKRKRMAAAALAGMMLLCTACGQEEETAEEELPEGTLIDPNTGETVTMPTEEELESEDAGDMMGGIDSPILPADGSEADTGEEDASQ